MTVVTPKPREPSRERVFSVRMPEDLFREIERISQETQRTRTETTMLLLRYAVDAHNKGVKR